MSHDKLQFKLLMIKRVKAFALSLQAGLSISEAIKKIDEKYPVSEEYREFEKSLKEKEKS
jgi:hypothetical protein